MLNTKFRRRITQTVIMLVSSLMLLPIVACVSPKNGHETPARTAGLPPPNSGRISITAHSSAPATMSGTVTIPKVELKSGQSLTVRGHVVVVGNEPHTRAIIRGDDGVSVWEIFPLDAGPQLWDKQGYPLEISGTLLEDGSFQPLSWKIVN